MYCYSKVYVLGQYMLCIVRLHITYCDSTCFIVTVHVYTLKAHIMYFYSTAYVLSHYMLYILTVHFMYFANTYFVL